MGYINCGIIVLVTSYAYNLEGSIMETATKKFVLSVAVCLVLFISLVLYTVCTLLTRSIEHKFKVMYAKVEAGTTLNDTSWKEFSVWYKGCKDELLKKSETLKAETQEYKDIIDVLERRISNCVDGNKDFQEHMNNRFLALSESLKQPVVVQQPSPKVLVQQPEGKKKEVKPIIKIDMEDSSENTSLLRKAAISSLKNYEKYLHKRITKDVLIGEALRISARVREMEFTSKKYIKLQQSICSSPRFINGVVQNPYEIIKSFPLEWETYIKEWRETDWSPKEDRHGKIW